MGLIGRLLAWLFPDPCANSAEIRRQMLDIGDEDGDGDGER